MSENGENGRYVTWKSLLLAAISFISACAVSIWQITLHMEDRVYRDIERNRAEIKEIYNYTRELAIEIRRLQNLLDVKNKIDIDDRKVQ